VQEGGVLGGHSTFGSVFDHIIISSTNTTTKTCSVKGTVAGGQHAQHGRGTCHHMKLRCTG
jgi:hypothetical protein